MGRIKTAHLTQPRLTRLRTDHHFFRVASTRIANRERRPLSLGRSRPQKSTNPMATLKRPLDNAVLSSSPAFGTPPHPVLPAQAQRPPPPPAFKPIIPTILPILLPPPTLRPLAFRTFTKKHNLTLTSSALQALATFIGRHCGSGWREEGTGEKVLEEVARLWKAESLSLIHI